MSMAETGVLCDGCDMGKTLWKPFIPRCNKLQLVGGLIHADVNGPISVKSLQGAKFYVCFNDDYSTYRRIFFIK